jgi:hypothetical protein
LNDPFLPQADKVASKLGFYRVGQIYTNNNNDLHLSSSEIRSMAEHQHNNMVKHSWGYDVSKFVTVVVKPSKKIENEKDLHCYMVSD